MMPKHDSSRPRQAAVRSDAVRKRYLEKPSIVSLKMEAEFLRQVDDEVLYQSVQKGHVATRSDTIKELLREALAARAKKRK